MAKDFTPSLDASLGLVYRLNILWNKADWAAEKGEYDKWNAILDSIYRNLLYREEVITNFDEKTGEITLLKLSRKDTKIYKYISKQISIAKQKNLNSKNSRDKARSRSILYNKLQLKDIWLRKFMQSLKLYLKETEQKPGSTLFGTFGGGKK